MITKDRHIEAGEGMILTNGVIFAKSLDLGDWDSADNYREITAEEYEQILFMQQAEVYT